MQKDENEQTGVSTVLQQKRIQTRLTVDPGRF